MNASSKPDILSVAIAADMAVCPVPGMLFFFKALCVASSVLRVTVRDS